MKLRFRGWLPSLFYLL